jgi:hypothetical protein
MSAGMVNVSVLDGRRSRDNSLRAYADSRSVNYIMKLGQLLLLVFTPASLAYSLLSMGGDFRSWTRKVLGILCSRNPPFDGGNRLFLCVNEVI